MIVAGRTTETGDGEWIDLADIRLASD
jgi:hypothetical protein